MPDIDRLREIATRLGANFTGPLLHARVLELARAWLPDIHFHEVERFHSIDLDELYTVPAEDFPTFDELTQQAFSIEIGGAQVSPPIVRVDDVLRGHGTEVQHALRQTDVHDNAVYSHGGNLAAAEKFFGAVATPDGTAVVGIGNPRLPREPLRVRVEFRMLLETLERDLALAEAAGQDSSIQKPLDAIWGDFDVTDLLLRRLPLGEEPANDFDSAFQNDTGPALMRDAGPASISLRHRYARDLIQAHRDGRLADVETLLESPPSDGPHATRANRSAWLALTTCGLLEYHFIYAYNDFHRYGGLFTNEHEGDNEGCCLVFERERLAQFQDQNADPLSIAPLALITSVHDEVNHADEIGALDPDPGDAREGLAVYVARGSHATYLTPGSHDFFGIWDAYQRAFEDPGLETVVAILALPFAPLFAIYEHFNGDPDETSDGGVTGQADINPWSDPDTHLPVELVATPLSSDENIYMRSASDPTALALRSFRGRLGGHSGLKDHSPRWGNKTRRYFRRLVHALEFGLIRDPARPILIE